MNQPMNRRGRKTCNRCVLCVFCASWWLWKTVERNHEEDYIGLAAESFISEVKKRYRVEATPIPTIYDEEVGGLRLQVLTLQEPVYHIQGRHQPRVTVDYVAETWVEGHLTHWNHYDNDGSRTANAVEDWNHKFTRMYRRPHPNIFIQLIQKEQDANETKML
uniref:Uncharacterized protein n=1 Tax=Magallana gigas TaxID=29159 RepID=K1R1H1_MAGGI